MKRLWYMFSLATSLLMAVTARAVSTPYGLWEFNNNLTNRVIATGGTMTSAGTVSYVAGVGGSDTTAIQVNAGTGNRLTCAHAMPANGGGSCVNEYTMMWDVRYPSKNSWKCLLQTNQGNGNDGDFFVRNTDGALGSSATMGGYSGSKTTNNTWYRVVLVVDSSSGTGNNDVTVYVNGSSWLTKYDITLDSVLTLDPSFLVSEDDNNEDDTLVIGSFAVWNKPLSASDVAALGAVGSSVIQPPVITEGATTNRTVVEDQVLSLTHNATDPNADTLTWSVLTAPSNGTLSGFSGVAGYTVNGSYTPAANFSGTDSFVVRVTDPSGLTDNITNTVTVTSLNDMPSFMKGTNLTVNAGSGPQTVANWATAITDGDPSVTQTLTFNVSNDNTTLFTTQPTLTSSGTLNFTPSALLAGSATVTVSLTDDATAGGPALTTPEQTFTIAVANTAPVIGTISDRAITEGSSTGPIDFTISDTEQAATALTLSGSSDNTVLVPTDNILFGGSGQNRTVTVTPAAGQRGSATLTVTVSDGALNASTTFVLTVTGSGGPTEHQLVVTSLFGGATPPVGTNVLSYGIPVLCSVTNSPSSSNGIQYACTGWSLSGGVPASGVTTNFTLVPTNEMTLAWNWSTNYWLDVQISGGGELSQVPSWFAAGSQVTVQAITNAAWRFVGWIGSTNGCSITGTTLEVTMTDPTGPITALFARNDPTLTVLPVPGTCTPASGTHVYATGSTPACSAQNVTQGTTQFVCTGWTLWGASPHSGSTNSFTATITRDAMLAWQWTTNYWLDTAESSGGYISLPDGWQMAGVPIDLVATPHAGYRFLSWSGDTNGCTVGNDRMTIPMDRARGQITATFILDSEFTMIGLPDTQNYSTSYPTTFNGQCQWIVNNIATRNIKFVTHVGDIVNTASSSTEWTKANTAMSYLDGQVPFNACRGNHDMSSNYLTYFGPNAARWKTGGVYYDWYKGASPSGNSSYQMIKYNGRTFLMLNLDVDAPGSLTDANTDIGWAQAVINSHRGILTILSTHDYLAEVGSTSNTGSGTGLRGPTCLAYIGGGHSGLWLRNNFVLPNNEIFMVLCGHNFAQYNLTPLNNAGNPVHEIMIDYQTLPNGGNGFLRIMAFKPADGQIVSTTWSTSLNRFMTQPANSTDSQGMLELTDPNGSAFTIDVDFDHRFDGDLTVTSAYGPVSPVVGVHSFAPGTPVLCSAPDIVSSQTRRRATGWTLSGSQSGSGSGNSKTVVMNGNATLNWQWATDYWLSTAEVGDGQVSVLSGWQPEGGVVTLVGVPDAGAEFTSWSGDTAGCTIASNTLSMTMTRARGPLTAQFTSSSTVPVYTLTVASTENTVNPAPGAYLYASGSVVRCSAQDVALGGTQHVCTSWSLSDGTSGSGTAKDVTLGGDRTLTWSWSLRYNLSVSSAGPGSVTPVGGWFTSGANVTLTAIPDAQATFVGWEGDLDGLSVGGETLLVPMNRARGPVIARFAASQRTLIIISDHGILAPSGTLSVAYGTIVTNAVQDETVGSLRYVCDGWQLNGLEPVTGTSNVVALVCTNDATLTWLWKTQVLVRASTEGQGIINPLDVSGWHTQGGELALTATPARLYRFAGWTGAVESASTSVLLPLNAPAALCARFVPETTTSGTPLWWLERHGLTTNNTPAELADQADVDGDRLTAAQEYQAGTSPTDASSLLNIVALDPAAWMLTWRSVADRIYSVHCTTNLMEGFVPVRNGIPGQSGETTTEQVPPALGPQCFWRVSTQAPEAPAQVPVTTNVLPKTSVTVTNSTCTMGDALSALTVEKPAHRVTLSAFEMDRTEVTRAEWRTVAVWANAHGYDLPENPMIEGQPRPDDHPVTPVSWYEAVKWCNARSEMAGFTPAYYTDTAGLSVYRTGTVDLVSANVNWSGSGYRLPTEAEWESGARGGLEGAQYPWGDGTADTRANQWEYWVRELNTYPGDYPWTTPAGYYNGGQTVASGHVAPDTANGFGLYDMAGNVMEWCWDRRSVYAAQNEVDPRGTDSGDTRALRGGSWWNEDVNTRCAFRYFYLPDGDPVYGSIGLRCVRTAEQRTSPMP